MVAIPDYLEEGEGGKVPTVVEGEDRLHTEVKLETEGDVPVDGEVVAQIRRMKPGELSEFHGSMKLGWVQVCPFCSKEVGTLVDHVKAHHSERSHRQIRTRCPHIECAKLVVDIKNHIRMVHQKVRNYQCDECDSMFVNNYQVRKHKEGVHSGDVRVKCEECDMMLKTTTLDSHVKRVHRGVKASVPCSEEGCGKVFGSKADLERHVLGKHMRWKAPCPECGKKFRMECLHQHIMTVHKGIYPFTCPQCKQGFQNQKGLSTHVRTRHQGVFLHCRAVTEKGLECGKVILSEEGLISHMERQHLAGARVACPQCGVAVSPAYLPEHLRRRHLGDQQLVCVLDTCGDVVTDRGDLRRHVEGEHAALELEWCEQCSEFCLELGEHRRLRHEAALWEGEEARPVFGVVRGVTCHHDNCDFMATGSTHLARHVKLKHENKVSVKCELCGKKTFNMEKHVRIQHDKQKTLECDVCEKKFITPFTLRKHRETHTAVEDRKQKCPRCGVEVTNMKQHERFVHQKDLRFSCSEEGCETRFTSKHHLKKHMESVHEKAKLSCPQCEKMIGINSLASHIRIVHEKRRDHVCPQCQKTFQNKSHLRNHVQRVHLQIREECPDCGKMVQDLHNHHQFVHLKVKNFPCNLCDTRCTTSTALKKHIRSVHLDEHYECPECGDMVKHLEQHIRQKHGEVKKKHQCPECQKFFTCGTYLSKHIMRVHLGMRETCPSCGLETKDLARHRRTACTREGYTPRRVADALVANPLEAGRLRTKMKREVVAQDSEDEEELKEEAMVASLGMEPATITGDLSRRSSCASIAAEVEEEGQWEEVEGEDLVMTKEEMLQDDEELMVVPELDEKPPELGHGNKHL